MSDQQSDNLDPTLRADQDVNYQQPGFAQPNEPTAMMPNQSPAIVLARLIFTSQGPRYGEMSRIESKSFLIGRDTECHLQIQDETASRQHAKIRVEGSGDDTKFMLHDLATDNGTHVNGQHITGPVALMNNDVIRIGYTELTFKKI